MRIKQIDSRAFGKLSSRPDVYFCNGCLFLETLDNLLAFCVYEGDGVEPSAYYEVVYE